MNTIESIGRKEAALQKQMPVEGYIEHRDVFLKKHGIYEKWREIYSDYVALAQLGDLEALKRAIFYAWYQLAEPGWLSGISKLPDHETKIAVEILEQKLADGFIDEELKLMLPYYMTVCSYYLERFYPLPSIQKASELAKDIGKPILNKSQWNQRGKMGDYWCE